LAGIGFELKKIFREQSVFHTLRGAIYSSFATIGPVLMIVVNLIVMYFVLDYVKVDYAERDLFASTILYVFIFSLIITAPLNSVLSRYIADKIFQEKREDIMPSYYVGLIVNIVMAGLIGIPFALWEVFVGKVNPLFVLLSYCMFTALTLVFFNMTYVSALKEYKRISMAFLVGMTVTFIVAFVSRKLFGMAVTTAIILGFTVGFLIIGFWLYSLIRGFFAENSRNYRDCINYIKYFKMLFLTNLFYILGLYVHNFVFWWFSDFSIVVRNTFRSAPVYDMSTCLAMFTNISTMVIFMVQVEVNFHDRYQAYCQEVIGGTGSYIYAAKREMFRTLLKEVMHIIQIQMIITVVIFLVAIIFLPQFGFGGMVMVIYPGLAAAYFLIFVMYSLVIFLYYYDDEKGALLTTLVFFIGTFIGTIISLKLTSNLYGLGTFIGAFCGWSMGYYRLKHIEKNLDKHIFCNGELIKKVYIDSTK